MSRKLWITAAFFPLVSSFAMMLGAALPVGSEFAALWMLLFALFIGGGVICKLAYFIHMLTNTRREMNHRVMWVIGLLFFGDFLLPFYYFIDVRPYLPAVEPPPMQTSRFKTVASSPVETAADSAEAAPEGKAEKKVRRLEPELDERGRRKRRNEMRRPRRRGPW